MHSWMPWRSAMRSALYGEDGFFRRHRPTDHFRTSPVVSEAFAGALLRLADRAGLEGIVDVGAGSGELLTTLAAATRDRSRFRLIGVELADRPSGLPSDVSWWSELPAQRLDSVLLVANEWLDNVPVDLATLAPDGSERLLEVAVPAITDVSGPSEPGTALAGARDAEGAGAAERLGSRPDREQQDWLNRWWPLHSPGQRAEIGSDRDHAWTRAVEAVADGLALAIDYGHGAGTRPFGGTLTGWRNGRPTSPTPDGLGDITAHVAFDALREAGEQAGAVTVLSTTQRNALRGLGVTGTRPPLAMAQHDPRGYLSASSRASSEAELLDRAGLGSYDWLLQEIHR